MTTYKLVAVNDDECTCSVCGKTNLAQVAWLIELDADGNNISDIAFPVGTTCAAKLTGIKKTKVAKTLKTYDSLVWEKKEALKKQHPLFDEICSLLNQDRGSYPENQSHPATLRADKLRIELDEWVNAQEITITI